MTIRSYCKILISLILFVAVVIFLPAEAAQNDYSSGGSVTISGAWDDGSTGGYTAGNCYVPAGMSTPQIPSFSTNNLTPTYFFPTSMNVNSAGFTNTQGSFINVLGIAFVDSGVKGYETGTSLVAFTNGLDGTMFYVDGKGVARYGGETLPLEIWKGLDNVASFSMRPTAEVTNLAGVFIPKVDINFGGMQFKANNITYQNVAFLNENLANMMDNDPKTINTVQLAKNPSLVTPYTYGYTNLPGDKVAAIYVTADNPFAHFSYSTGAYVMPQDTLVGGGKQYIAGLGVTPASKMRVVLPDYKTNTYDVTVGPHGDWVLNQGRIGVTTRTILAPSLDGEKQAGQPAQNLLGDIDRTALLKSGLSNTFYLNNKYLDIIATNNEAFKTALFPNRDPALEEFEQEDTVAVVSTDTEDYFTWKGPVLMLHGYTNPENGQLYSAKYKKPMSQILEEYKAKGYTRLLLVSCNPANGDVQVPEGMEVVFGRSYNLNVTKGRGWSFAPIRPADSKEKAVFQFSPEQKKLVENFKNINSVLNNWYAKDRFTGREVWASDWRKKVGDSSSTLPPRNPLGQINK